jgi:hypothetical protein
MDRRVREVGPARELLGQEERAVKRLPALLVLAALAAAPAAAQNCQTPNGATGTCSLNVASSLTIPTLLRLSIDDTTTALTVPTETIYDAGTIVTAGPIITLKTNNNWTLLVRAAAANWTGSGVGARANKPAGDLAWGTGVGGPFTALTTISTTVATGTRGASNVRSMYYRVAWSWPLDTPGTYTLVVIYTATSP